jgi:hypothetical protein
MFALARVLLGLGPLGGDHPVECSWEVFRDLFIQDARPQDARSVWERLVPQPFQPWAAQLELREFYRAGLPKSYIAVADDRALPAGTWHPGMSSRLGRCKIIHMAGSHEVMFTRPAELAARSSKPPTTEGWRPRPACRATRPVSDGRTPSPMTTIADRNGL